ncbi:MAG: DinB family protein [Gemmatimonadales bacterium]
MSTSPPASQPSSHPFFPDGPGLLRRTPRVLDAMLRGLPDAWGRATEGPGTWSPFDVVGHLIHGERADWMLRVEHILAHGPARPFPPFDREAMLEASRGRSLDALLDQFAELRNAGLHRLAKLQLTDADLTRGGLHPDLGSVTLGQHLSTWVAHDLGHLVQVSRTMGRTLRDAVGPWRRYLRYLDP